MGDVAYSGLFNLISTGRDELGFIARMNKGVKQQEVSGTIEWLAPFVFWLPQIKAATARMYAMARRALDARRERGTARKDLFYYLVDVDSRSYSCNRRRYVWYMELNPRETQS
jgi:hypothetical protein